MTEYAEEFKDIISQVSKCLGRELNMTQIMIKDRGVPHNPPKWEKGMMAVYTFSYKGHFLKIGKAGQKSKARFTNQHYNPGSANSTLAASILRDSEMSYLNLDENSVGDWIKNNCRRIDVMIPVEMGIFALELVESIFHFKYEPKYEGFNSQR